jgi:nucleotide-binding universal stress UspA family protein
MNEGTGMSLKSILAATDLSAHEHRAVMRALQLSRTHDATLKLVHVPSSDGPMAPPARAQLTALAKEAEAQLLLNVQALPAPVSTFAELNRRTDGIDLIVLPHRRERSLAAFLRGQAVAQLLRECDVPVLVVREVPDGHYVSMVVAVDFSGRSLPLGTFAAGFAPAAELRLFHAIGTRDEAKLMFAGASDHALRTYRERCMAYARSRMGELTQNLGAHRSRLLTQIGRGDAARQTVLHQDRSGADLIVVGKTRRTAWEDFVSGSIAQRVLDWGTSDVLIVPDACLQGRPHAGASPLQAAGRRPALGLRSVEPGC